MRIIDYINILGLILGIAAIAFAIISFKRYGCEVENNGDHSIGNKKSTYIFLSIIMIIAAFMRLYRLGGVPYGLQQDEASLGYDAFCLATKGIDRNGYPYPIYPITWGCGGGSPLMIYLNVISIRLFGTGVVKLRLLPAILGIGTVFLFFHILRESFDERAALFSAAFLALCPWHVILSRWSLDSNVMPFFMLLAMFVFIKGIRSGKTIIYCLSAALYGICMYCYGSANIVIPIHLVLISIYCLVKGKISAGQLVASALTFVVICLPLGIFYAVNYLGVPEILTGVVSFNKFTASRTGEVFLSREGSILPQIAQNLKTLLKLLTFGDDSDMTCHYIPGFSTLFKYTFPITFFGIWGSIAVSEKDPGQKTMNDKTECGTEKTINALWLSMLISCLILGAVISVDISRMVMIFLPLIYFFTKGLDFIFKNARKAGICVAALLLASAVLFSKDYFQRFNGITGDIFMPGYGEAIARAYELAGDEKPIFSTYEGLSAPFVLALYYTDYDPDKFYSTVEYKDPMAEFRIARSFGNFYFGDIPESISQEEYKDTLFVVYDYELERFTDGADCRVEDYGNYHVVYY